MIELDHGGIRRMRMRVDQAGQHGLAAELDNLRLRTACLEDVVAGSNFLQRRP